MILGKYNFGDNVLIDTQNGASAFDVYLHEITHYSITQGSICGNLMIALSSISELREPKLKHVLFELYQSSIVTQEMTAIYVQEIYERMIKQDLDTDNSKYCMISSDYHKKYCLDGYDTIISYPQYVINNKFLLVELATISLNFDITENEDISYTDPLSFRRIIMNNPSKYNADYRYKKLVEATVQLINEKEELCIDRIIALADIEYKNKDYQIVKDTIFRLCNNMCKVFSLDFDNRCKQTNFNKSYWAQCNPKYKTYFSNTELFIIYGMSIGMSDSWWWNNIYDALQAGHSELIIYFFDKDNCYSKDYVKEKFLKVCNKDLDVESIAWIKEKIYVVLYNDQRKCEMFNLDTD